MSEKQKDTTPTPTPTQVKNSEIVGRRIEKAQVDFSTEEVRYSWSAFYDSRINENLSVDFIADDGNKKIEKKMPGILTPIALKDFEKSKASTPFVGWAGIRRKTIKTFQVLRTPVTIEDNPENPNPHHCDIIRDDHRSIPSARSLAYELCAHAEEDNLFFHMAKVDT